MYAEAVMHIKLNSIRAHLVRTLRSSEGLPRRWMQGPILMEGPPGGCTAAGRHMSIPRMMMVLHPDIGSSTSHQPGINCSRDLDMPHVCRTRIAIARRACMSLPLMGATAAPMSRGYIIIVVKSLRVKRPPCSSEGLHSICQIQTPG